MNQSISRVRLVRSVVASLLLVPLLFSLGGCWLINVPPTAAFTVSSQTGQAPFPVNFSGTLSEDEDGVITQYEWNFGDGTSGQGANVTHMYTTAGEFSIVLRVTDNDGETGSASKKIYVSPPELAGPVANFSASPTSGTSPLTVYVDAALSSYDAGVISRYVWNWGDGATGYGRTASHTYFSAGARTYTQTLTVEATDGKSATATRTISVTVAGGGTTDTTGAPSARFDIVDSDSIGVAPFKVGFNPEDSEADDGRTLAAFVWSYGDDDSDFDVDAVIQEHVFTTRDSSEVFSVTLLVLDNESDSDTITKTVKAYNHHPVAGFEIADPSDGDTLGAAAANVHFVSPAVAVDEDHWHADDITYGNLQQIGDSLVSVSVLIRSAHIDDADWFDIDGSLPQDTLRTSETLATSATIPIPDDYDDNEYSYDPEGQTFEDIGVIGDETDDWPAWFPNRGWGIQYLYVDWDDDGAEERFDYDDLTDNNMYHVYQFDGTATSKTITVRAVDYLGAEDTFSRIVFFREGVEQADESDL